jgi:hypothetical protein
MEMSDQLSLGHSNTVGRHLNETSEKSTKV